jgi:hypothetical protein
MDTRRTGGERERLCVQIFHVTHLDEEEEEGGHPQKRNESSMYLRARRVWWVCC